jgi:hypothetical protein
MQNDAVFGVVRKKALRVLVVDGAVSHFVCLSLGIALTSSAIKVTESDRKQNTQKLD